MKPIVSVLALVFFLVPATPFAALAEEVTILYTGGIHGQLYSITTCAETMESYGGLPRLSTMINGMKPLFANPVILIDGGNFVPDTRKDVEFKADVTMSALKAMQYDAVGIGASDLRFNADQLKQIYETYDMPMVGSNLVEKQTGADYGTPYTLVTSGPLTVAILSMVPDNAFLSYNSASAKGDLDIVPAEKAVSELLAELEGRVDVTVLFTNLNKSDTGTLVSKLPGIDIAMSNDTAHNADTFDPASGPPYVLPLGLETMSLGRLTLVLKADGEVSVTDHELIALDNAVPADEAINGLIYEAYQAKFKREREEERARELKEFIENNEEIQELHKLSPMEYINRMNQQTDKGQSEE